MVNERKVNVGFIKKKLILFLKKSLKINKVLLIKFLFLLIFCFYVTVNYFKLLKKKLAYAKRKFFCIVLTK